jgi:hypothetical protein
MNKKSKLTTTLVILFITAPILIFAKADTLKAKVSKPKAIVSINFGSTIPVGKFADKDFGGAARGPIREISFNIPLFHSHFGIAATLNYALPVQTGQALLEKLNLVGDKYVVVRNVFVKEYNRKTRSKYGQQNFMLGANYLVSKGILNFTFRTMIGYNITFKQNQYTFEKKDTSIKYYPAEQSGSQSRSISYDIGLTTSASIGKRQHFIIGISADYFVANGSFSTATLIGSQLDVINYNFPMSAINVGLSAGYIFR